MAFFDPQKSVKKQDNRAALLGPFFVPTGGSYLFCNAPHNLLCFTSGTRVKHIVTPILGKTAARNPHVTYSLDFVVTPHAGVDPKTVQYLAGHENSKTTMDIYAQIKYNQPEQLYGVVSAAFSQTNKA